MQDLSTNVGHGSSGIYYAHSRPGSEPGPAWELLEDHLRRVGELAARFASSFQSAEWGRLAGRWHDLGKYRTEFQRRLSGEAIQVEHAGAGAALAVRSGALPLAFVIAGHHAGLANRAAHGGGLTPLSERLQNGGAALDEIADRIPDALRRAVLPALPPSLRTAGQPLPARSVELWTRFLFSALVDADYLATEAFYTGAERAVAHASLGDLADRLDRHLARFPDEGVVNEARAEVLGHCRAAASLPPGLFSLTVPTGGGKTLSALAFALHHARIHGHGRVVAVMPFTTIIEQTAAVYRDALGDDCVLEHHSAVDEARPGDINPELELRRRLAAENWDTPLVATTAVQFFESLFANRTSRCRKLHNIARSVIVLDEAQTLPAGYLLCVLDALQALVDGFGCTIVLSTATQPALARRPALPQGLTGVREIMPDPAALFARLQRVRVEWPETGEPMAYRDLAARVAVDDQVLVITHRRADARILAELLPAGGRYHLSALMCAAHRAQVVQAVKDTLGRGEPCRLISTQLIEAGVDVDFPVVYRALAGLDSLAQAAGRCNRNGTRPELGRFVVFNAETDPPWGIPQRGARITAAMLQESGGSLDLFDAAVQEDYFRRLYHQVDKDRKRVVPERNALNFATVASLVQLVEDGFTAPVVVPWSDALERVAAFRRAPSRLTQRALQPFIVQVRDDQLERLTKVGAIERVDDTTVHVLTELRNDLYDRTFGLLVDTDAPIEPARLVV